MKSLLTLLTLIFLLSTNLSAEIIVDKEQFKNGYYNLNPIYICEVELKNNVIDQTSEDLFLNLTINTKMFSTELLNESIYLLTVNDDQSLIRSNSKSDYPDSELQILNNEIRYSQSNNCFNRWNMNIKYVDNDFSQITEVSITSGPCRTAKAIVGLLTPEYYTALGLKEPSKKIKCSFKK